MVKSQWSMVNGQESMVKSQWSIVNGRWVSTPYSLLPTLYSPFIT
ncbi:hypothetical protein [Oscillatoria sp. FACHB-1407]|nr:hypothetical protein [Oscillatoria sp. FACHB-1407]